MVVAGEGEDDDVGEGRVVDVREDDKAVRGRFNPINDVFGQGPLILPPPLPIEC